MAITGLKNHAAMDRCWTNPVTAPSGGYTQGQMVKVQDVVGIIMTDADEGEDTTLLYKSPSITVPCETASTGSYADKAKVYFDAANARVTETASGNTLCGIVIEQPATGATEVKIALDGTLGITS